MGGSPIQLSFTLRTSPNCKTVHLIGNWDNYKGQLPLSKDAAKPGAWKGTFRFQGNTLSPGQRYWYYYIMDGYHVSHDPAKPFTTEPTTKRQLNILDVPPSSSLKGGGGSKPEKTADASSTDIKRRPPSITVPKGRPLSPSRIVSPKPVKPGSAVDNITRSLAHTRLASPPHSDSSDSEIDDSDSDAGSDASAPSLTSSSSSRSGSSCASPLSDGSTSSQCSCNRFGITRKGDRVRLDCGGSRCGYSDASDCSDSEPEAAVVAAAAEYHEHATRRQGVVIRGSRR